MKKVIVTFCAFLAAASLVAQPRTLDDFEDPAPWTAVPSDNVKLAIGSGPSVHGQALRLDFDFQGGAGYAVAHRPLAIDLPANWEISFRLRAEAPVNNLEFKLIDPSGENVWWVNRRNFEFPREWKTIKIKKRQLEFARGPIGGGEMKTVAALELAVTAGTGGKGTVWIDDLTITELPPAHSYDRTPARTSGPGWTSLDFLESREYGGLVVDWEKDADAANYIVEISDDGKAWTVLRKIKGGNGGRDYLYVPETESRHLRLRRPDGTAPFELRNIDVKPLDWAPSINDLFKAVAKDAPRGFYPRAFFGEQPYWTVVGVDGDTEEGLLGEDGALEVGQGAFSIEPFLWADGDLISWAGVQESQTLAEGYLPIPTVTWTAGDLSLEITAFASPSGLWARYLVRNRGRDAKSLRLVLALRPFQVNPPTQFLNNVGGVSSIREIAWDGHAAVVNGARSVIPATAPNAFGATTFDGGEISEHLRTGKLPTAARVSDSFGYASGAFAWDLDVPADGERRVDVTVPFASAAAPARVGVRSTETFRSFDAALSTAVRDWHERLDRVEIRLPAAQEPLVKAFKTAITHILINRDGPAIQPGSRSYARTWIRDGSLTSSALLRAGHSAPVRELIEWFAPFQFPNGKVPCCVDARGADPVPENDSHGELLFLVTEYWRYTHDRATVEKVWPHVEKAVAYIDELRHQRRTDEYRQPAKLRYFGLLPESISHEGYSAKPVHSYWDDFFALTGLKDAADLARALGKTEEADRWAAIREEFRTDLYASINRTIAETGVEYIPASAELADADPTSTTTAISPGGELENLRSKLPSQALEHTFERYWKEIEKRKTGDWKAYTPYEFRAVGAFVRMGWTERAHELLDLFMNDRRPAGWNQWPEVVYRDQRAPTFLGDLPHTWVASDFMRSFLDLLAYERDSDHALILAAGIPDAWIAAPGGVAVRRLPTPWGLLDYSLTSEGDAVRLRVGEGLTVPPGGIVFRGNVIRKLPAEVVYSAKLLPPVRITSE
jgi:Bacterial alpha-L-rhamnosidase 6 hairpin glycosidase domain